MTLPPSSDTALLGLPVGFWDGIIGAVIGGILTGVAGFIATWYADHRQNKREFQRRRAERDAAVKVVRYELGTNASKLEMYVAHNMYPGRLTDAAFQGLQLLLTQELPETLSVGLVWVYEQMAVAENNISAMRGMPTASRPNNLLGPITAAAAELDATRTALADFLAGHYDPTWLSTITDVPQDTTVP